jgi:hypothetical protein
MQLRNIGSTEIYHVPTGVGKALIAAKMAEEVVPVVKQLPPASTWETRLGERDGFPPYLYVHCSTCGNSQSGEGPTVHKTAKFLHCRIVESCPPHIAKEYETARERYKRGTDAPSGLGVSPAQREIENQRLERFAARR